MKCFRLLAAATVALSCLSITLPALPTPELSYADRLSAQEAIERVYYAHQIGATKPFEQAVPREVIGRKVRTTLQQSVALETYWNTHVKDADLDREVDRMVRTTRMADRLRELFAALGNDPIMIRECLARPALVSRLLRSFYASDPRIHAPARAEAEELRLHLGKGSTGPKDEHYARGTLELVRESAAGPEMQDADQRPMDARNEIGQPRRESTSDEELKVWRSQLVGKPGGVGEVREERGEFVVPVLLEDRSDAMTLAIYSVPKKPLEIWWKEVEAGLDPAAARPVRAPAAPDAPLVKTVPEPATASPVTQTASCTPVNTWDGTSLQGGPPLDRYYHTAVWTGSVMVVWGGFRGDGAPLNSGGRYDPATDTWEATSTVGAPQARGRHSAVWTGTRMIIWGGRTTPVALFNSGGQYDPILDTWTATSTSGAPDPRYVHSTIWTGSEMLVWGGSGSTGPSTAEWLQTGGRYNPDTDSWTSIQTQGAPEGRNGHAAVWTGTKMIVWGGLVAGNVSTNTGGRYDPSADTWEPTSLTAAPSSRAYDTAVWIGTRMIVWSGLGGQYNPVLDTWSAISMSGAPTPRSEATSIWTGTHLIVWGGINGSTNYDTGGRYDPASNTWTATSTTGAPWARFAHSAIWTGNRMIIWGGVNISVFTNTGGRYDPSTDSWLPTAIGDAPPPISGQPTVWTGSRMIVWGGGRFFGHSQVGGRYDPALNEWTPTSLLSAPSARSFHTAVWAGSRLIIWGGQTGGLGMWTDTGGRYDPITDTWSPTSLIGAPSPRRLHAAVWTGDRMIVWGGSDTSPESNTGGRYDPYTDTWLPTSLTNAPESRVKHTAIWTGSRMIIWGGSSSQGFLNSGGVYDPVTDAWSPTLWNLSTPQGRVEHTALWTGSQMIVWGGRINVAGCSSEFEFLDTGGRYDPSTDSWSLTAPFPVVNGASGRRAGHTAVWNGSPGAGEMIVWGGYKDGDTPACNTRIYPTGGRYNPVSDSWTLMTLPAPEPRAYHSAVSTGNLMLIWGGEGGFSQQRPLRDGGSYVLVEDYDGDSFGTCDGDCNDTDPSIHPGAVEACNGVDENCNGATDEGFDQDGDGRTSCNGDCNDLDPGTWGSPVELSGVIVGQSVPTNLNWSDVGPLIGPGVTYDMVSGSMGPQTGINFSSGACLQSGLGSPNYTDPRTGPSPDGGYWYLVRSRNSCGIGTFGASSSGAERILPSCP